MIALIYLIPLSLVISFIGLMAFRWSLKTGQYDDLEGAALRVLDDTDENQSD